MHASMELVTLSDNPIAKFADRLHEATVRVAIHSSLDWSSMIALAADLVAAGIDGPATVELACARPDVRSDDCRRLLVAMLNELGLPQTPPDPRVLGHLVDNDDIDSLMAVVTIEDIAGAWLRSRRGADGSDAAGPDEWASELWYSSSWYSDRARTRATVIAMLEQADADDVARIGSGPLENLVVDDESALQWVDEQARISPQFRVALTHAWLWNQLSADSFDRVQRAAGAPLPNPNR